MNRYKSSADNSKSSIIPILNCLESHVILIQKYLKDNKPVNVIGYCDAILIDTKKILDALNKEEDAS